MEQPLSLYDLPTRARLGQPDLVARLLSLHGLQVGPDGLSAGLDQLMGDPARCPVGLLDALYAVTELASDTAHDELIAGLGGPLFAADVHAMPPWDVALLAWLDHRSLFNRVRGRRVISSARRFQEFKGREASTLALEPLPLPLLEQRLGSSFSVRGRSAHCRVHVFEQDERVHFDVTHGRPRVREGALHELDGRTIESAVEYRPQQVDRVTYAPSTGVLRVTARDARTLRTYCEVFGDVLFGSARWFSDDAVLTLNPLLDDASAALRPTRGIERVDLVHALVRCAGHPGLMLSFRSEDVYQGLAQHGGVSLHDGELVAAHLRVTFTGGGSRVTKLALPNHVAYDNHRDEAIIRSFLEERGFVAGRLRFRMAS